MNQTTLEQHIRKWRIGILGTAFLLPVLSYMAAVILSEFELTAYVLPFHRFTWADHWDFAKWGLLIVVLCNWPLLAYSVVVTHVIRKYFPDYHPIYYKCLGGLILTMPLYLFVYAMSAWEQASEIFYHGDGPQSIGIIMAIVMMLAPILLTVGWFLGSMALRVKNLLS